MPEEALPQYIGVKAHKRLAKEAEERARVLGIKEEDVPRLVDEVRRENRNRGRR